MLIWMFFNLVGYKSDRTMINEIKDDEKGQIIKPDMTQFTKIIEH